MILSVIYIIGSYSGLKKSINKKFLRLIFLVLSIFVADTSAQSILFNHLTTNNGLSNNFVSDIFQDRTGFLWFATDDGLNRFDGYDFKIYRNNPADKNSISDNTILSFTEDADGNLWNGTKNGFVNKYDLILDKFTRWEIKSDITKENPINVLHIDKSGLVWIGTYRSGLYRLDPNSGKIDRWVMNADDPTALSNNYVSSIVEDALGNFWIGTFYGLNKLNLQKSKTKFEKFFFEKEENNSLSDNLIWSITQSATDKNKFFIGTANGITELNASQIKFKKIDIDNPDNLQFGTGSGVVLEEIINGEQILWTNSYAGLIRLNSTKNNLVRYLPDKSNPNSIASYQVNKILKDRSGVLWLATNKGLSFFSQKNNKINNSFHSSRFDFNSSKLNTLSSSAILKTKSNTLYIGTEKGLFYSSNNSANGERIKNNIIPTQTIWSLAEDNQHNIWVGTYGDGLYKFNPATKRLEKFDVLKNIVRSSSRNFIKSLAVDNNNNLWAGTWGIGLAKINLSTNEIKHFHHLNDNSNSLSHDDVWVIFIDSKDRIWIGTNGGGLNLYNELNGGLFYCFGGDSKNQIALNSNSIYSICESSINKNDGETILWIGTNNGLNKVVIDNSEFTNSNPIFKQVNQYTITNGLADNSIKSVVEDDDGNLWLGTSSGISFFDISKNSFTNFTTADGVIGNDFNYSSGVKIDGELIILGSTSGINFINPKSIIHSSYNPPIVISDFQIFNKSIKPSENSVLTKSIFNTNEIVLSHTQNVFSFLFSALDYNNPNSISYVYMMEGFDKDWITSGTRRYITYTNLNPGKYVFKVKATNSDGVWNDKITSLIVEITPPWWQTIWAILMYFVVFVLGIWAIIKFQNNRTKLQHELRIREFESYHLKEVEQMKSRFFANISHEFRTPLMLIKGPLEELLRGRIKDNLTEYYKMLLRNTEKLQHLIDQLLELSQLESETIPVKKETYDIVNLLKSISNSFIPLANQKNIRFKFHLNVESAIAFLDKDKFEKIINNLLNNAFKFTDVGGNVNIELNEKTISGINNALISISDSGVGISKENQPKIFNRFFQVDDSSKRNYGGSGIGLALVKELTTLLGWEISVSSNEGEGTEFTLQIPLLSQEEIKTNISLSNSLGHQENLNEEVELKKVDDDYILENNSKPLIVFVEDQSEVRDYVLGLLKHDYNVLQAENGKIGLDVAINSLPDLIISDVMMPVMDGFELCKKLKTDWKTSHIPVILLTAKVAHQSKLEGLETGADDYLTKPFDFEELSVRIKNLIAQRKLLKEKFSKDINANVDSITTNLFDKEFIEKIYRIIESQLQNENFTSENLAKELFVSRSQLTRKLNAITGIGPGEFIRIYKLKRAAQMILENKLSITQVALEVGFSSPAQFTRAFQKHFNCLPSEFHLSNHKK
jgi:signal transduction histidine kinase/ligand-binding sensor domain-containing protein/DNA-binding response OmpR family regulator